MSRAGNAARIAIIDYIRKYYARGGFPPTIREIGEFVGLRSTSTIHSHLRRLTYDGELYMIGSRYFPFLQVCPTAWNMRVWRG